MGIGQTINDILQFKEGFVDRLSEYFGRWGCYVYDHPWRVLILGCLVNLIAIPGFIPPIARWIEGADNLYALPVSEARNEGRIRDNLFSDAIARASFMIVTSDPPGYNVLTWEALALAEELDEIVRGLRPDTHSETLMALPPTPQFYPEYYADGNLSKPADKEYLTYEDICAPDPVTGCRVQSVFEMGVYEMKLMLDEGAPPELYVLDGYVFNTDRKGFAPTFVLGDPTITDCVRELPTVLISQIYDSTRYTEGSMEGYSIAEMQCITEAKALHFVYELHDKPEFLDREMAWEALFYDILMNNEDYGNLKVGAMAYRSRDDELSKSTAESDDVIFVVYTFMLLIFYTTAVNFNVNAYRSKVWCSLGGSLACLLGLFSGLGIPSLCGMAFVPTSLVVPFLVMGVGADDIFVIISSYSLTFGEDSSRQRCGVTLRGCGVSVVMTTVTNVVAFAIGIQSPYLAIRNFCVFTLAGLSFSLIYELTIFYALMCLDARREEEMRVCYWSLKKIDHRKQPPFDNNNVVSTYQVVHVIVEQALRSITAFERQPVPSKVELSRRPWYKKVKAMFTERGNYWYRPECGIGEGAIPGWTASRDTSTTGGGGDITEVHNNEELQAEEEGRSVKSLQSAEESHKSVIEDEQAKLVKQPTNQSDALSSLRPNPESSRFVLHDKLRHPLYRLEPSGTVGRRGREIFAKGFGRWLLHPYVKMIVLFVFAVNIGIAAFGFTKLTKGLEMRDLSPDDSYLKTYDKLYDTYCHANDLPVEVFFANSEPWWDLRAQKSIEDFVERIMARPENNVIGDPMTRMLADATLEPSLRSGNKTEFLGALKQALTSSDSAYKQFEYDFAWQGEELLGYRMQLLPAGTTTSQERAHWMLTLRADCEYFANLPTTNDTMPIKPYFYNYMLVFYESDIQITKNVIANISTAAMAMLVCAFMLIPDLASGMLVIVVMLLIDYTIIGYMAFWEVPLNMISMIILVISIGFAVDYSAHITYAFVNGVACTRNLRTIDSMVLIGMPLFHGAMANFLGIMLLGFSTSYILRIFFKMMTLVVLFGISHGLLLLPVLLTLVGKMTGSVPVHEDELPEGWVQPKLLEKQATTLDLHNPAYDIVSMSVFTSDKWTPDLDDDSSYHEDDGVEMRERVPTAGGGGAAGGAAAGGVGGWYRDGALERGGALKGRRKGRREGVTQRVGFISPTPHNGAGPTTTTATAAAAAGNGGPLLQHSVSELTNTPQPKRR